MAFRLSPPVEQTFHLEEIDNTYDPDGSTHTTVTIKQASEAEHEKRQDLWATMTSKFMTGQPGMEITHRFSWRELMRKEVFLTLVDSNIEDEDGKPLFRFDKNSKGRIFLNMNEQEFAIAWGKLPADVAIAIHNRVLEVNPDWSAQLGEALYGG